MLVKEKARLVGKTGETNTKYRAIIGSNPFTVDSAFLRGFMSSFLIAGQSSLLSDFSFSQFHLLD